MKGKWLEPEIRDSIVDFVNRWSIKAQINVGQMLKWMNLHKSKFYEWKVRYGKENMHNAFIPRDHWLSEREKQAIIEFHGKNPLNGYRRLCYMMIDQNIVAVSPSSVRNVLKAAGLMDKKLSGPSSKGKGFNQPSGPHTQWHTDISYINVGGTFYYLSAVLDGYSRYIVHWTLKERMTEEDVEILLQKALEKFPGVFPRVITDNGPQYIARDFKLFVRLSGMTHVRTSPFYPQSNGKIEAWHKTIKKESIRPVCPTTFEQAREVVTQHVQHYNEVRLHSAIGYITPADKLAGRASKIFKERESKLEAAKVARAFEREAKRAAHALVGRCGASKALPAQEAAEILSTQDQRFSGTTDILDVPGL